VYGDDQPTRSERLQHAPVVTDSHCGAKHVIEPPGATVLYPPTQLKLQPATRLALELREPPTRSAVAAATWRRTFDREFDPMRGQGGDHASAFLVALVEAVERGVNDQLPRVGLAMDTRALAESIADTLVPELGSQRLQLCVELGIEVPGEPLLGQVLRLVAVHVAATLSAELLPVARAQRGGRTPGT
jgi:hypothetical protein